MPKPSDILVDSLGRKHNYLRISITEKCNLRCSYCMPAEGLPLMPKKHLMTSDEIYTLAEVFVKNGVDKIRLTGGEPLVRKDFTTILQRLSSLPVDLTLTTNAVLVDRYIDVLKSCGVNSLNVSLDTLQEDKFLTITKRDEFQKTLQNIQLLIREGFHLKLNVVLMKGFNDNEIIDFISLTKELPIALRFIEFMPFQGNSWDKSRLVTQNEILKTAANHFGAHQLFPLEMEANATAKNYKIAGFQGSFGIISSVSNPFCDTCNRIRLTANGKIKNCLFSNDELDLLTPLRDNTFSESLISEVVSRKKAVRGGMTSFEDLKNPKNHNQNRSMLAIGG
ncbi:MAG: GTP 3',8-cyclase MoaA [Flavobacteriales bacterium]|nr:GTP 3',8-cyclase MoaA [Flavobacteriales bacterium]